MKFVERMIITLTISKSNQPGWFSWHNDGTTKRLCVGFVAITYKYDRTA